MNMSFHAGYLYWIGFRRESTWLDGKFVQNFAERNFFRVNVPRCTADAKMCEFHLLCVLASQVHYHFFSFSDSNRCIVLSLCCFSLHPPHDAKHNFLSFRSQNALDLYFFFCLFEESRFFFLL